MFKAKNFNQEKKVHSRIPERITVAQVSFTFSFESFEKLSWYRTVA